MSNRVAEQLLRDTHQTLILFYQASLLLLELSHLILQVLQLLAGCPAMLQCLMGPARDRWPLVVTRRHCCRDASAAAHMSLSPVPSTYECPLNAGAAPSALPPPQPAGHSAPRLTPGHSAVWRSGWPSVGWSAPAPPGHSWCPCSERRLISTTEVCFDSPMMLVPTRSCSLFHRHSPQDPTWL